MEILTRRIGECYYKENNYENAINYYKEAYKLETKSTAKMNILSMVALNEYLNNQIDSSKIHFQKIEQYYSKEIINYNRKPYYAYIDYSLYKYYTAEGDTKKAQQYLADAYNHIPEEDRNEYLMDDNRLDYLHKYYYIHEIIETYNQNIR